MCELFPRVYTDRPAEDVGEDNVEDEEIAKIEEEVEIEKLGLGFRAFLPNAEVSKEFSEEASTSPDGMCIIDGELTSNEGNPWGVQSTWMQKIIPSVYSTYTWHMYQKGHSNKFSCTSAAIFITLLESHCTLSKKL